MDPLISVIIPVYKVEAYLDQCVQSIVNQTYKNLEIILVDDGSPDRCPQMCDDWALKDSRIKVIHKENGGASDSRNAGLKKITGDYVMFVDSDDVVAERLVETLLSGCVENDVQMAMCSLQKFKDFVPSLQMKACSQELLCGKYICSHFFECFAAVPFAKLFHKSLVAQRSFILNRRVGEDVAFNYPIIYSQARVAYNRVPMYFYRCNESSATGTYKLSWLDELDSFREMLAFFLEKKEMKIYDYISAEYFARLLANENKLGESFPDEHLGIERVRNLKDDFIASNKASFGLKVCVKIGVVFPGLFRKIFFKRQSLHKKKFKES